MLPTAYASAPRVFQGSRFDVHSVEVTGSDGARHRKDVVAHPGSVLIVPVIDRDHVALIRNYRLSSDQTLWELPAGTLEPVGEDPLRCAQREIIEETGYRAGRMEPLITFFACPGISTELMHAFVAHDLEQVGQDLDTTESITPHVLPWRRVMEMLATREIRDAKTIAGLLYYDVFVRERSR